MRFVTLCPAEPGEERLLAEVRARWNGACSPAQAWTEKRMRLERHVWRVPGQGCAVYVKRQLYRSFRVRFRYCVRPSPLTREARMASRLQGLGLTVPVPLLLGEQGRGWWREQSLLVTRELPGDPAGCALSQGRLHLVDLAALVAELGRLGLFHPDLHLNNLLHGPEGLALLDLQSVRLWSAPLGRGRLVAMAAKLGVSLQAAGLADALQWQGALAAAGLCSHPASRAALAHAVAALRARDQSARLRRCLENSSEFAREPWGGGRLFRRRAASRAELLAAARAAFGRGRCYEGMAADRFCLVGPGRSLRSLWLKLRLDELREKTPGPAEALVERGRFWGKSCLVFRSDVKPEELPGVLAITPRRLAPSERIGPGRAPVPGRSAPPA